MIRAEIYVLNKDTNSSCTTVIEFDNFKEYTDYILTDFYLALDIFEIDNTKFLYKVCIFNYESNEFELAFSNEVLIHE